MCLGAAASRSRRRASTASSTGRCARCSVTRWCRTFCCVILSWGLGGNDSTRHPPLRWHRKNGRRSPNGSRAEPSSGSSRGASIQRSWASSSSSAGTVLGPARRPASLGKMSTSGRASRTFEPRTITAAWVSRERARRAEHRAASRNAHSPTRPPAASARAWPTGLPEPRRPAHQECDLLGYLDSVPSALPHPASGDLRVEGYVRHAHARDGRGVGRGGAAHGLARAPDRCPARYAEAALRAMVAERPRGHPRHVCPARPGLEEPNCHPLWVAIRATPRLHSEAKIDDVPQPNAKILIVFATHGPKNGRFGGNFPPPGGDSSALAKAVR